MKEKAERMKHFSIEMKLQYTKFKFIWHFIQRYLFGIIEMVCVRLMIYANEVNGQVD